MIFKQVFFIHRWEFNWGYYSSLSQPRSNGNKGALYTSQNSKIGASSSENLEQLELIVEALCHNCVLFCLHKKGTRYFYCRTDKI